MQSNSNYGEILAKLSLDSMTKAVRSAVLHRLNINSELSEKGWDNTLRKHKGRVFNHFETQFNFKVYWGSFKSRFEVDLTLFSELNQKRNTVFCKKGKNYWNITDVRENVVVNLFETQFLFPLTSRLVTEWCRWQHPSQKWYSSYKMTNIW